MSDEKINAVGILKEKYFVDKEGKELITKNGKKFVKVVIDFGGTTEMMNFFETTPLQSVEKGDRVRVIYSKVDRGDQVFVNGHSIFKDEDKSDFKKAVDEKAKSVEIDKFDKTRKVSAAFVGMCMNRAWDLTIKEEWARVNYEKWSENFDLVFSWSMNKLDELKKKMVVD